MMGRSRFLTHLILIPLAGGVAFSAEPPAGQLRSLNERVKNGDTRAEVLRERATVLSRLIESDPAQALALALPSEEVERLALASPETAALVESHGQWYGRVSVVVEFDSPQHSGRTRIRLEAAGETLELHPVEKLHLVTGEAVGAKGIRLGNQVAASVTSVQSPQATPTCNSTGALKYAVLVYEFPSSVLSPSTFTLTQLTDVFFSKTQLSVAGYFGEASYGKLTASGDVFGPFSMDKDYSFFSWMGDALPDLLRAADSKVTWRNYNRIYVAGSAPGGGISSGVAGGCVSGNQALKDRGFNGSLGSLYIGNPRQDLVELITKMSGANFGLGSADALDAAPLSAGPPGAAGTVIGGGDMFSNLGQGMGHYAAPHKFQLGWLGKGTDYLEIETAGTYHLPAFEDAGTGVKALRVRRAPQSDRWLWLEYRQPHGYDQQLLVSTSQAFLGALVHYDDPAEPSYQTHSLLLDFNPPASQYDYRDFRDAVLASGKSWSDAFGPLSLRVGNAGPSGLDVTVTYETPCASISPTTRSHGSGVEIGTIAVSAPANCSWVAAASVDWITIRAGQSGKGAGTVEYLVNPNSSRAARTGMIYAGRQTATITQASAFVNIPPLAASVTPASGTGFGQTLTFVVSDPNGAADLEYIYVSFLAATPGDPRACTFLLNPLWNQVHLNSDGNKWLGPITAGSASRLQNSLCGVDGSGVHFTSSGTDLKVTMPVVFTADLAGDIKAQVSAYDFSMTTADFTLGSWKIPQAACIRGLDPISADVAASGSTGTLKVNASPGCAWLASSNVPWITITSGESGSDVGAVAFRVDQNLSAAPRIGSLTIADQLFGVRQAGTGANRPMIAENGVSNSAGFRGLPVASSCWIAILGANLSQTTRQWTGADFVANKLPEQLDGVGVTINGKPAYVYYISPTQINVLAPDDSALGDVQVVVTTPQGRSDGVIAQKQTYSPAFFMFAPEGSKYVAGVHTDGTYLGKSNLLPGVVTRPAKPGEVLLLYATGFGPTNPALSTGEVVLQPAPVQSPVTVRIGNVVANVRYAGVVSPGLYQINVTVPEVPDGDQPVAAEISGLRTQYHAYLTVAR